MKRLGLAFVCFGMFLAGCGDHVENPSAGSNLSSHHLSKNRRVDEAAPSVEPGVAIDLPWELEIRRIRFSPVRPHASSATEGQ